MIRDDDHAEFRMSRRDVRKEWIDETLRAPNAVESTGARTSIFKCLPGRRVMLRMVTPGNDQEYVVSTNLDRARPCA